MSKQPIHDEVWTSLGETDADWAVETTPDRRHGGWAGDLAQFYETGRGHVAEAIGWAKVQKREKALDWGSGTGRLALALAGEFNSVTCVDISRPMQATLRERAAERDITNLDLVHVSEFQPAGDHDFALSLITLQHFPDKAAVADAVTAMVRALKPGGVLVIEMPLRAHSRIHGLQLRFRAYRVARRVGVRPTWLHDYGFSGISMICVSREWMCGVLESAGASVREVRERSGTSFQQAYYVAERTESY